MKRLAPLLLFAALLCGSLLCGSAPAQDDASDGNPPFTQAELDQMLAPIALYPDALLAQILMAATYPLEVVEAARWSRRNPALRGEAAVQAVEDKDWDPSVKSLAAFPQILATMDQKLEWTERLGDAFLAQSDQVTQTVQSLRRKARDAGTLASGAQIAVRDEDGEIAIDALNPDVVYVPYYDATIAYGPWWWPDYPPIGWGLWSGYAWSGPFAWGLGIGIAPDFFFGYWDWPHRRVIVRDRRHWFPPHGDHAPPDRAHPWQHDRDHRRLVPYRNEAIERRFPLPVPARPFEPYRGRERQLTQPVTPPQGPGRPLVPPAPVPAQPVRPAPAVPPPQPRERAAPAPPPAVPAPRPNAFEGIGQGREVRDFSARGHASQPAPPPVKAERPPGRQR